MQTRSRILASLTFALLAVTLNGCASTGYAADSETMPATASTTMSGQIWTTADGMTLYTFAKDSPGESSCYDKCAQLWPPYLAADEATAARFVTTQRKDGTYQWTLNGAPLYTWIKDTKPGDTKGHGVKNVWFAARADHAPVKVYTSDDVMLLTDLQQMTLYTFDKDTRNQSNCNEACAAKWPPLTADSEAEDTPPYSVITRKDGEKQWARNGQPLYRWVKDIAPGDASGDGVKGVWHTVDIQ